MINLYSLTLQKSSAIPLAVFGNFTNEKHQEIAVSNGKTLELFREVKGKLKSIFFNEVFGIIRSLNAFRLIGLFLKLQKKKNYIKIKIYTQ